MTESNEVIAITQGKSDKKAPKKTKRDTSLDFMASKPDVMLRVADMMAQHNPAFSKLKYITVKTKDNIYLPATITDSGLVSYADETDMFKTIRDYALTLNVHKFKAKDYTLTEADCREVVSKFKGLTISHETVRDMQDIRAMRRVGENCIAFHELAFNLESIDSMRKCPLFAELVGRCTNSKAFVEYLGSIFDFTPINRQQYLWLYGEGMNGKGSICDALLSVFKDASHKFVGQQEGKYWTALVENKTLVVFDEVTYSKFTMDSKFMSMTGGETINVERKGKDSYEGRFCGKIILTSNEQMSIKKQKSNLRRALYCTFSAAVGEQDFEYKAKLQEEIPAIASYCYTQYLRLGTSLIQNDATAIEDMTDSYDFEFDNMFDQLFEEVRLPTGEPNFDHFLRSYYVFGIIQERTNYRWTDYKINHLLAYIERKRGLPKARKRFGHGEQHMCVFGISKKDIKIS